MKTATPNPNLRDFWFTKARYRVLYGGRDSTKSWDAASVALFIASQVKMRFLCTRKFQNRIEESVYVLLKNQIDRFGYKDYEVQKTKITHLKTGSEFFFYGLARNIAEIKSLEGVDVLWNEESHFLTESDLQVLIPTIRKEGSQIWFIFNPDLETDYIYQNYVLNPPDNAIVRRINYDENKWLSEVSRKEIEQLKERDYDSYLHVYEGQPKSNDESSFIKRTWVQAAVDAHTVLGIEPSGARTVGYDVADSGKDKNATVYRRGIIAYTADQWNAGEDELMQSCSRVHSQATTRKASITYDSIGVGAGCGSKFKELPERVEYQPFNAAAAIKDPEKDYAPGKKNKDHFTNIKAQQWQDVADRFLNTYNAVTKGADYNPERIISISGECEYLEQLITELSSPKKEHTNGKLKVESKKDMEKRGLKSPNLADAFIMAFVEPRQKPSWDNVNQEPDSIWQ